MSAALHPLDLPELAAALWRTAFFVLACAALGQMVAFIRWPGLPRSRRILMSSLAIATLQPVVVNVQRWGEVIYLEGLPVQTVYVLLGLIGVRVWITETTGSRPPTRLESATMNILDTARDAWRANPVRVAGYIAALVVFLAAKLGVVIDEQDLLSSLLFALPIILGVEKAQAEVMPVTTIAASNVYAVPDKGDRHVKKRAAKAATTATDRPEGNSTRERRAKGYSGLSAVQRIRARRRLKAGMDLMLKNAPAIHYTQGNRRWEGITKKLRIYKGDFPRYCDCSSSTTYLYWDACKRWLKSTGDFVNGTGWTWGWTGTQEANGVRVTSGRFLVGDLVQYGGHVAMVYKAGTMSTAVVWSHGSEAGPMLLPIAYRKVAQVRRYL